MANSFNCLSLCYSAGLSGKEAGKQFVFHCPGPNHSRRDKKPSLWIDPHQGIGGYWKCFPCGVGGGRWQLAAFLSGYSWRYDKNLLLDWISRREFIDYATERKSQRATTGQINYKILRSRS